VLLCAMAREHRAGAQELLNRRPEAAIDPETADSAAPRGRRRSRGDQPAAGALTPVDAPTLAQAVAESMRILPELLLEPGNVKGIRLGS
jgi:hypothetical protein